MTIKEVQNLIFKGKTITRSSTFGKRTYYYSGRSITDYHLGWDFVYREKGVIKSTNVYAVEEGIVYKIGKDNVSGNYIYIKYPSLGIILFYCHLKKIYLKKNTKVNKGQKVALTGTTGNSTGIHLHLGVKLINSDVWVNPGYISIVKYNYVYMASKYLKAYSKISTCSVNLRKSAGLGSIVSKVIPSKTIVKILDESIYNIDGFKWDKVEIDGTKGYIANKYLNDVVRITTTKVNSRIRPGTNKTIVKTFNKGKKVKINKRKYEKIDGLYFDQIKI